ncbi:uncharacterized protein DFL_003037 [Arthrobotrys flagrans]|uniref:SCP domain-containing protein n=1 Tax=Arthrobotrys flagrans TaxID=97331 RepID=A0A437ACK3_ARTFL|nr:hypothetical protein DFL_003037 [Arthrobotrys flagrans]
MKSSIFSTFLVGASALAVPSIGLSGTGDPGKRSVPSGPDYYYSQQPNQPPTSYQSPGNINDFIPESEYRDALLRVHNDIRAAHDVPALTWSQDLVNYAMTNSPSCEGYGHTQTLQQDGIGENILFGQSTPEQMVRELWYDKELKLYDFSRQEYSGATGHLTQMIWKGTTEVGCMGNIVGQFEQNCNAPKNGYNSPAPTYPNGQNYQNYQSNGQNNQNYQDYQSGNPNHQNSQSEPTQNDQSYQSYQPTNYNQNYQSYNYIIKRDNTEQNPYQQPNDKKKNCEKIGDVSKETEAQLETTLENEHIGYKRPIYSPLYETQKGNAYGIANPNFNMVPGKTFRNIIYDQR